jgi:lipopolysaccharide export LptBFGC system permease protein LptF
MRLLDRYLFRHALIPLMFCLLGFVSLTVIIDVFGHLDEIMKRNIPWRIVGEYYLHAC